MDMKHFIKCFSYAKLMSELLPTKISFEVYTRGSQNQYLNLLKN